MEDGENKLGVCFLLASGRCEAGWRLVRMSVVSAACWLEAGVRLDGGW